MKESSLAQEKKNACAHNLKCSSTYFIFVLQLQHSTAVTMEYSTILEMSYNQTVLLDVLVEEDILIVNLKNVYLMVRLVMPQVILTMDHLTQRDLTFKEIVNTSSLNHVTTVTLPLQQ